MSLLGNLFGSQENLTAGDKEAKTCRRDVNIPRPPRPSHRLCGIYNQGATCYMNSLLQTIVHTPEFRELLFALGPSELGRLENKDDPTARVRVIPIELQRLFARLMLLNQQAVSTQHLTDSFGWTNNEEFQQHDVQELNRILFAAIEESLVGTAGEDIIKKLYHGLSVNQIKCLECGRISEREEEFLDLVLSLTGVNSIEEALTCSFVAKEDLTGNNQYRCDGCNKLVDARKGAVIRRLPSILTVSLLRFNFDFVKLERYKETRKCTFPMELDMAPYCEQLSTAGNTEYELAAVVIHKGGTHGGHYHAYIRDVDELGAWVHPDEEEISLPMDPFTGKVDYIEFDSPIELLQALLLQQDGHCMQIEKLAAEMTKQTGVSWNKRFKKSYGPINKFLKKYDDKFVVDDQTKTVAVKDGGQISQTEPAQQAGDASKNASKTPPKNKRPLSPQPPQGWCWFNFDDSRVHPIRTSEIEKQFSGKESAYMLLYRRKDLSRPSEAKGDPAFGIPDAAVQEVLKENDVLQKEREEYEKKLNTITVEVHFSENYEHRHGALHAKPDVMPFIELTLDRRKPVSFLKNSVSEIGGSLVPKNFVIHSAKALPAGLHLYDCISENEALSVMEVNIYDRSKIFVWDGWQVGDLPIPFGADVVPVLLTITHGNPLKFSRGFPCNMTLNELRSAIEDLTDIPADRMVLTRVHTKGDSSALLRVTADELSMSLAQLKVTDGDNFIAEDDTAQSCGALAEAVANKQVQLISFIVENRCLPEEPEDGWRVLVVEVEKSESIADLKKKTMQEHNLDGIKGGGRLRLDDDSLGLRTPLMEDQSIEEAGLRQGQRLVLEIGAPPTSEEITLVFTRPLSDCPEYEASVDRKVTVQEALDAMVKQAGLSGDQWHLRKTNWCGEATDVLDNLDATLDQCQLKNGDLLLIEEGQLPPKGFLKLSVSLCKIRLKSEDETGLLSWISNSLQGLWSSQPSNNDKQEKGQEEGEQIVKLDDILIWKEATLSDLKQEILNLPRLADLDLPTVNFLRLRLLENGRPGTILRGNTMPLQRLKVTNDSKLVVQLLGNEEDLDPTATVLCIQRKVAQSKVYLPAEEFIWLPSSGITSSALRNAIAAHSGIPLDKLVIAKHFPEKFEWAVIKNSSNQKGKNNQKKKVKENLKKSPLFLKDGDVIGIKDLTDDPLDHDDFKTEEDLEGLRNLQKAIEEKRLRREQQKELNADGDCLLAPKRREVGIRIHVANFR